MLLNEFYIVIRDILYLSQFLLAMVVNQSFPLTTTMGELLVYLSLAKETVAVISSEQIACFPGDNVDSKSVWVQKGLVFVVVFPNVIVLNTRSTQQSP